ncbi:hypothetical protein M514_07088, partial [Trichuris suis]
DKPKQRAERYPIGKVQNECCWFLGFEEAGCYVPPAGRTYGETEGDVTFSSYTAIHQFRRLQFHTNPYCHEGSHHIVVFSNRL